MILPPPARAQRAGDRRRGDRRFTPTPVASAPPFKSPPPQTYLATAWSYTDVKKARPAPVCRRRSAADGYGDRPPSQARGGRLDLTA
ncbi:MAG: hypothetical protein AAGC95_06865 [Pseudomonadota bacterium]